MYYWAFLFFGIFCEVVGTLFMRYSIEHLPFISLFFTYAMLIISYSALAIAVKAIPLTVAYGAWESLGLVFIAILSTIIFFEPLSAVKMIAITLILIGMWLLSYGTTMSKKKNKV